MAGAIGGPVELAWAGDEAPVVMADTFTGALAFSAPAHVDVCLILVRDEAEQTRWRLTEKP